MEHLLTREQYPVCMLWSVITMSGVARKGEVGLPSYFRLPGNDPIALSLDYRQGTRVMSPEESLYYAMR